jgi:hypothetical protein
MTRRKLIAAGMTTGTEESRWFPIHTENDAVGMRFEVLVHFEPFLSERIAAAGKVVLGIGDLLGALERKEIDAWKKERGLLMSDSTPGAVSDTLERAAGVCEGMVVGGRAWTEEQKIAGEALLSAAKAIRTLKVEP